MLRSLRRFIPVRSRRRPLFGGLLIVFAALAAGRLAAIDGWIRPIYVVGPSMAPTLWGPTRLVECASCGKALRMHQHAANPLNQPFPCRHCGAPVDPASSRPRSPDRVLIDRAAYWWRKPRHGELIAIENGKGGIQVKRVIGLPGDEVSLQGSELRINGTPVEAAFEAGQVPSLVVFKRDASDSTKPTFQPGEERWQTAATGWIVYHHRSAYDGLQPAPIRDDYPANTAETRQLMPVTHKQLTGNVTAARPVRVDVEIWVADHAERFRGEFPAGHSTWSVSSLATAGIGGMLQPDDRWRRIELGVDPDQVRSRVSAQAPIAVRVAGLDGDQRTVDAQFERLVVRRHLHWYVSLGDQRLLPAAPIRLAADRYFVVGDNLPLSDDSRQQPQGIDRARIVGRVVTSFKQLDLFLGLAYPRKEVRNQ